MTNPSEPLRRTFPAGTILFEEGAVGKEAYIIESGFVSIYKTLDGAPIALGEIETGGIFGEMALIDDQPRMASAVAIKDTVCVIVGKDHLAEQLDQAPRRVKTMVNALLGSIRLLGAELAETRAMLCPANPPLITNFPPNK